MPSIDDIDTLTVFRSPVQKADIAPSIQPFNTPDVCRRILILRFRLLKIFASNEEWEKYWKERMDLNQKVMLSFKLQKHLCR